MPKVAKKKLGYAGTLKPTRIKLYGLNNEWIFILDTPGFNDPLGKTADMNHAKEIAEHIVNFGEFHALCLVIKYT